MAWSTGDKKLGVLPGEVQHGYGGLKENDVQNYNLHMAWQVVANSLQSRWV
jgi:hypothetical protein